MDEVGSEDFAALDKAATDNIVQTMGDLAPPAKADLSPAAINSLGAILDQALDKLTEGQVPFPESEDVKEPQPHLPAAIFAKLMALTSFVKDTTAAASFDPTELAIDDEGLNLMSGLVGQMGRNRALLKEVRRPDATLDLSGLEDEAAAEEPSTPEAPAAPAEDGLADLL